MRPAGQRPPNSPTAPNPVIITGVPSCVVGLITTTQSRHSDLTPMWARRGCWKRVKEIGEHIKRSHSKCLDITKRPDSEECPQGNNVGAFR